MRRILNTVLLFTFLSPVASAALPNDPLFSKQWAFQNIGQKIVIDRKAMQGIPGADINLLEAWNYSQGSGVKVGVIDSGVWGGHLDFAGRVLPAAPMNLQSPPLSPAGWNFSFANGFIQPSIHATHVAGIIGAAANNGYGGAGVAPGVQIVPMQALDEVAANSKWIRNQDVRTVAGAMRQAGQWGLSIVNMSIVGELGLRNMLQAAQVSPGTLFIVASGNSGVNLDSSAVYPCSSSASNIICVGASNIRDKKSSFSNYSKTHVDLFAPGEDIMSTALPAAYHMSIPKGFQMQSGTSMATPMVSGVAALMKSANPALNAAQIKRVLTATVDRKASLAAFCASGGRLNAGRAVRAVLDPDHDGVLALDEAGWKP